MQADLQRVKLAVNEAAVQKAVVRRGFVIVTRQSMLVHETWRSTAPLKNKVATDIQATKKPLFVDQGMGGHAYHVRRFTKALPSPNTEQGMWVTLLEVDL